MQNIPHTIYEYFSSNGYLKENYEFINWVTPEKAFPTIIYNKIERKKYTYQIHLNALKNNAQYTNHDLIYFLLEIFNSLIYDVGDIHINSNFIFISDLQYTSINYYYIYDPIKNIAELLNSK